MQVCEVLTWADWSVERCFIDASHIPGVLLNVQQLMLSSPFGWNSLDVWSLIPSNTLHFQFLHIKEGHFLQVAKPGICPPPHQPHPCAHGRQCKSIMTLFPTDFSGFSLLSAQAPGISQFRISKQVVTCFVVSGLDPMKSIKREPPNIKIVLGRGSSSHKRLWTLDF